MNLTKILYYSSVFYKMARDESELEKYNLMQLYKENGSRFLSHKDEMVGGTQEDPILETVSRPVIIPSRPIGEVFPIKLNAWSAPIWFKVQSKTKAVELPYKIMRQLQDLQMKIDRDSWIGDDFVKDTKKELEDMTKSIASSSLTKKTAK